MRRIVLIFGLISGLISATLMAIILPLCVNGAMDFENAEVLGYSSMVLSFLLVFFGIRAYREKLGGSITFGKAFQVGILIVVVSSVLYVASWLVIYYNYLPDFWDKYSVHVVEKMRSEGAPAADIAEKQQQMQTFKRWSQNPAIHAAMTFIEPLPVGLIMSLLSAAILRRKQPRTPAPATAVA